MSIIFIWKEELPKKHKFFIFLKSGFVMSDFIDMNLGVFLQISVGFIKSAVS